MKMGSTEKSIMFTLLILGLFKKKSSGLKNFEISFEMFL